MFKITLEHMTANDVFAVRDLTVQRSGDPVFKRVKHFQFLKWPNYGIPDSPAELADFVWEVYTNPGSGSSPTVIHCSGGLGRSGTFTAVFGALQRTSDYLDGHAAGDGLRDLSLVPSIERMRRQRHPWMVEGTHQLTLAYQTLGILLQRLLVEKKEIS